MKTKTGSIIRRIQLAVEDLQAYSYSEFQHLLPSYIENRNLGYTMLDQFFSAKTGITIKDYFTRIKAEKAGELFYHYKLSPIEVAYQLGFKSAESLKKGIQIRSRYLQTRMRYSHFFEQDKKYA